MDVLRADRGAVAKARTIDARGEAKFLMTPVLNEISAGLLFARSRSEAAAFRAFASRITVLPFDEASALKAAEMRAELMRLGRAKGHLHLAAVWVPSLLPYGENRKDRLISVGYGGYLAKDPACEVLSKLGALCKPFNSPGIQFLVELNEASCIRIKID
jgi:predicted nucleic acid-binding protein